MEYRILILGINGLIGNQLFKYFSNYKNYKVFGILKNRSNLKKSTFDQFIHQINVLDFQKLDYILKTIKPSIVINCIGIVKHHPESNNPLVSIPINSILPHKLKLLCRLINAKLIQISTDCVFSGQKGNYTEFDISDANDLYGRSKYLGEIYDESSITIRTSVIGHELNTSRGLLNWFLSQKNNVNGFKNAFFSGLTTNELARVIDEYILPNKGITGLYHISGDYIDKYQLLTVIKEVYKKEIEIVEDTEFSINRTLDSSKFRKETGYKPIDWRYAIETMKKNDSLIL